MCKIKYRLAGYDNDWRIIANPARVWYVKLPPGNYTLEAMASNIRGEFSGHKKISNRGKKHTGGKSPGLSRCWYYY
ncbi:MAG: hypothetical protein IPP43_13665 [Chitinophagaceae bacterium]|nr:hypothetical protein [Chitinophagaceae bacterium]